MESAQKPLEERILNVGNTLLNDRPSSVDELLRLLDEVYNCLANVEQSPSKSMLAALQPSMDALVAKELLGHSDTDVKTAVATCISEITRITAPDAPYDDNLMKEIFKMIVATFENLHDMSSLSYSKRISILETMAKVRAAVLMLDLECDALILAMFRHFLKSIRDSHPDTVFSFMETIMTLVLEESESIPLELISCLLTSVKKDNQDVLPIASRMGEKVISNCSAKLKPYLIQEVESAGISLDDYSEVVASVCQQKSDTLVSEKLEPADDMAADRSPIEAMRNRMAETGKDETLEGQNSLKNDSEPPHNGNQLKISVATIKEEHGLLDSKTEVLKEGEPDQIIEKAMDQKSVSEINSSETSGYSHADSETKKADNTLGESPSTKEASKLLGDEKRTALPSPSESLDRTVNAASQSPNQSLPGLSQRKRGRPKKGAANAEVVTPSSPTKPKGSLSTDQINDNAAQSIEIKSSKVSEGNINSEVKVQRQSVEKVKEHNENQDDVTLDKSQRKGGRSRAKRGTSEKDDHLDLSKESKGTSLSNHIEDDSQQSADIKSSRKPKGNRNSEIEASGNAVEKVNGENDNQDEISSQGTESKQGTECSSGSEGEPLEHMGGKSPPGKATTVESSKKFKGDKKKPQTETVALRDRTPRESTKKKILSSKSAAKRSGESRIYEAKSKQKHLLASEMHAHPIHLDEKLVGWKIKVWWPIDKMFYTGTIDSFDPVEKKHKVLYDDGDVEVLDLNNETWEHIDADPDMEEASKHAKTDASDKPSKKKLKTSSDPPSKHSKNAPLKRGRGSSSGKSMVDPAKGSSKLKTDGAYLESKSEDDTPKTANKSKDGSSSKLKDNKPKTDEESEGDASDDGGEDDLVDAGGKLRGGTPKNGGKSKDELADASGKSKVSTLKTGGKAKDDLADAGRKSKLGTPKTGGKSKDELADTGGKSRVSTLKTGKSKDELAEAGGKLKVSTPRTGVKPKGSIPKAGSKSEDDTPRAGSESKGRPTKTRRKFFKEDAPSAARKSQDDTPELSKEGRTTKGMSDPAKGKAGEDTVERKSFHAKAKGTKGMSDSAKDKDGEDTGEGKPGHAKAKGTKGTSDSAKGKDAENIGEGKSGHAKAKGGTKGTSVSAKAKDVEDAGEGKSGHAKAKGTEVKDAEDTGEGKSGHAKAKGTEVKGGKKQKQKVRG